MKLVSCSELEGTLALGLEVSSQGVFSHSSVCSSFIWIRRPCCTMGCTMRCTMRCTAGCVPLDRTRAGGHDGVEGRPWALLQSLLAVFGSI